jgi:hypothetical protein
MKSIAIQISPVAKAAYFADYLDVARQEILKVAGEIPLTYTRVGSLEYFELKTDDSNLEKLLQLSFTQGLYAVEDRLLRPLDLQAHYLLHEDFVFGSKFKGKTNERLTQMMINIGLAEIGTVKGKPVKLLDPMCGRATTLLWAMRYGLNARGIEQDPNAVVDIQRNLKKWCKLHRQKHTLNIGTTGDNKKKSSGKCLDFNAEGCSMRVVIGDSRDAEQLLNKEKFDLQVCDLPYGVQHFTTKKTRNPSMVIQQCVESWKKCLKPTGAVVLAFNRNNPERKVLIDIFRQGGFEARPFSAPHRMSESIVRDVVIFRLVN